ncbi:unnamed protein product [Echinostoma caproni]|uniref:Sperm-tail PG-rich repeat n=1 Tax=Echinostoma caproni TaxID=27848 RepID=A0A183ACQ8_9TREM|nr:unnamed protein product [Echinostoma caproni]
MDRKRSDSHKSSMKSHTTTTTTTTVTPINLPADLAAARIQAGFRGYHFRKTHPELTHTTHHTAHQTVHHTHTHTPTSAATVIPRNPRATDRVHELTPGTAATRIQAGYRGYQTRKHLHEQGFPLTEHSLVHHSHTDHSIPPDLAAAKIQAGFRGYRTRRELKEQHKYPGTTTGHRESTHSHSTDIHSDPNYAATRIQATFRGYQTRRHLHEHDSNPHDTKSPLRAQNCNPYTTGPGLTKPYSNGRDPAEVDKAATIIQAGFRGYQTRKHLHSPRSHDTNSYTHGQVNKENAEQAATRIQAAYRGFVTRKHLHETGKEYTSRADSTRHTEARTTSHYTDPAEAATKIQATFRGYRTRQHVHVPVHSTTSGITSTHSTPTTHSSHTSSRRT